MWSRSALLVVVALLTMRSVAAAQPRETPPPTPPTAQEAVVIPQPERFDLDAALATTPGGLTADAAAERAVETAPSIARAEAAVRIADAGADRAWISVYPRLNLSARYTRLSTEEAGSLGGGGLTPEQLAGLNALAGGVEDMESQTLHRVHLGTLEGLTSFSFDPQPNQFALRAEVTYPVSDLFLTILPAYRASQSFAEAQRLQVDGERLTIAQRAREAFYTYLRARGALAVARSAVAQAEAHRGQVAALVEAGTAARVELMRVDAQIARARVVVARAEAGTALGATAIRALLHLPPDAEIGVAEEIDGPIDAPPETPAVLVARAQRERVELRALRMVIAARDHARTARANARLPHFAVSGGVDYANPNARVFPQANRWDLTWDVSAVLTWSPNDAFTADVELGQAEAEIAQARADVAALEDGVRLEVTQAHADLVASRSAYDAATVGLAAAEESYRVRREQLEAGVAVTNDLIDADAEVTRARLDALDALIEMRIASTRLRRALGD
jgi:outer membrane protein TolC